MDAEGNTQDTRGFVWVEQQSSIKARRRGKKQICKEIIKQIEQTGKQRERGRLTETCKQTDEQAMKN
jgi:hypothetical protein